MLRITPPDMLGRVSAVFSPLVQLANVGGMLIAGILASTVLPRLHVVVAGVTFGPYDTILGVAGLLFIISGLVIGPMRNLPDAPPGQPTGADEDEQAGPADAVNTADAAAEVS
jgi:hypothetical protein